MRELLPPFILDLRKADLSISQRLNRLRRRRKKGGGCSPTAVEAVRRLGGRIL